MCDWGRFFLHQNVQKEPSPIAHKRSKNVFKTIKDRKCKVKE